MTDRINSLTIVLERDTRDDDVQSLVEAMKQFRGVLSVTPNIVDSNSHVAQMRERARVNEKLIELLKSGL